MFDYERFNGFFSEVTPGSLDQLDQLYHADARFIDPAHELQGIQEIRAFWEGLLATVISCETQILHGVQQGERCYSRWDLRLRHPRLRRGAPIQVAGMSELRVEGDKVSYHRDFFDMGEILYEHLPGLGALVRLAKRRASS